MAAQGAPRWTQTCVVLLLCLPAALPAAPQPLGDYYDTLQVEPTATGGQIKKAFRKLAAKQHPDKNKSADAEKTFREIAEAYTVLSNQEKRRLYDSVGHKAFLNNEASAETEDDTNFHFSHFFHDFDDSPFVKEQHVYWSFQEEHEEEEHYCFEEQHFHWSFQEEEEEEEHYCFEEQHFHWSFQEEEEELQCFEEPNFSFHFGDVDGNEI